MIARLLGGAAIAVAGALGATAQTVTLEAVGSIDGPANLVRAHEGHAYVAAGRTLTIYSLANPAAARREGAYTFPEEIWGFRVDGRRVYVGANFFGLGILDVSEVAEPKLIGSFKTPSQTKIGAAFGSRLAIIDHMEGVVLVDTSDVSAPIAAGSFFLDGYARDVVVSGSLAYAVDSPSGLYVFDLSLSGPLEPIGVLHVPNAPHSIEVTATASGPTLVCGAGGGDLQIYDVTNPKAPTRASTFATPGRAYRVSLLGSLAFVADGAEGIQVVDLKRPAEPELVGSYRTRAPARDVSVDGDLVFIVVGERGAESDREVQILRFEGPSL